MLRAAVTLSYQNMQLVVSFYSTIEWSLVVAANGCEKTQSLSFLFIYFFIIIIITTIIYITR